jgi:hypothetical protein
VKNCEGQKFRFDRKSLDSPCPMVGRADFELTDRTSFFVSCHSRSTCTYLDSFADFPDGGDERFNLLLVLCNQCLQLGDS